MKERPMLFNAAMVRAILGGRKTQTRRVVKPQPARLTSLDDDTEGRFFWEWDYLGSGGDYNDVRQGRKEFFCPYGQPGDRLWVRETWRVRGGQEYEYQRDRSQVMYRATHGEDGYPLGWESYDWRPSIHMPRWASRITLEITGVRVERLNEISEADAKAEGIKAIPHGREGTFYHHERTEPHPNNWCAADDAYRQLWESINGPGSWEANPWVWVVEFRRIDA